MTNTETPGTPAITEPVAYLDRDGDIWLPWCEPDGVYLRGTSPYASEEWRPIASVEQDYGPLVPLVREDVVAAREAAAREEGRAEVRDAAHLVAKSHAEQIRQLRERADPRAEVAATPKGPRDPMWEAPDGLARRAYFGHVDERNVPGYCTCGKLCRACPERPRNWYASPLDD